MTSIPMFAAPAYAANFSYTGGADIAPQSVLNDHSTVYKVHATATAGLTPGTVYNVNVRLTNGMGSGFNNNARGFTWNPTTSRWVQGRATSTLFPTVTANASGGAEATVYFKVGDEAFTGWPAANGHGDNQAFFSVSFSAGGNTGNPSIAPIVDVLDAKTQGAWIHNGVATGAAADATATLGSVAMHQTQANAIDDDDNGTIDDEDYGPAGATGDFRFGVRAGTTVDVQLGGSAWEPGQGVTAGSGGTDIAVGAADMVPPTTPANLVVHAYNNQAILTWDASTDSGGSGLSGYRVFRMTGTLYNTAGVGDANLTSALPVPIVTLDTDTTTFVDSTAVNGTAYTYFVQAMDADTNVSARSNAVSVMPIEDFAAPVTMLTGVYEGGFFADPATFSLASDDGAGTGVAATYYRLDSDPTTQTYTAPVDVTGNGEHTVTYWSEDIAGNSETPQIVQFTISGELPLTTLSGVTDGWSNAPVTFTLSAGGINPPISTYYSLDSAELVQYADPVTVSKEGTTTLEYFSRNSEGSTEETKSAQIKVDTAVPYWVSGGSMTGVDTHIESEISLNLEWNGGTDDLSGVTQFRVWRSNGTTRETTLVATIPAGAYERGGNTWQGECITTVPTRWTGTSYYYKVQAGDAADNWSTTYNLLGGSSTETDTVKQGFRVYDGPPEGPALPPAWGEDGFLLATNVGTPEAPEVLFHWNTPQTFAAAPDIWFYSIKSDFDSPPEMWIDSLGPSDHDEYRDGPNNTYLWKAGNPNFGTGGGYINGYSPIPAPNTQYYFNIHAYAHKPSDDPDVRTADTNGSDGPIVPVHTAWSNSPLPGSARALNVPFPANTFKWVESRGEHKITYGNVVNDPVDPENAFFAIGSAGNASYPVIAAGSSLTTAYVELTNKTTGENVPLPADPDGLTTFKSNMWPIATPGTWTSANGTYYGYRWTATDGTFNTARLEIHLPTLESSTEYVLKLKSPLTQYFNNADYSYEFKTAIADKEAPVWPDGAALTTTAVTPKTVSLSWPSAEDTVGVTAYNVFRDGAKIASVPGTQTVYKDTGLVPGSTHDYYVTAQDYLVNVSTQIAVGPITTPIDTLAPTWPFGPTFMALNNQAASLDLIWVSALDDFPIESYRIFQGSQLIGTVEGNVQAFHVTGIDPGQLYSFTVQAGDESGNWSTDGPTIITGTLLDTQAPQWSNGATPTVTAVTPTSISLSWSTATDNHKVDHYEVFANGEASPSVTTSGTDGTVTGLVPASDNAIQVVAVDPSGNRGAGVSIDQMVPHASPTVGSGIPFALVTPSENVTETAGEVRNTITSLVPAGDLHLRFLFFQEMDATSLRAGITLYDETADAFVDLSDAALGIASAGATQTVDFATVGDQLRAGHAYALRLAAGIAASDATTLGKDYVWRFTTPVRGDRIVAVSSSQGDGLNWLYHHVELRSDGTVWSWGNNSNGQLGDGTTDDSTVPVKAIGLDHIVGITAGCQYTLALRDDGTVWGMGRNNFGQLGIWPADHTSGVNTKPENIHPVPAQVEGVDGVQQVSANWHNSSALRYDGTVWGWGNNVSGSLGLGFSMVSSTSYVDAPTPCAGLTQVTAIANARYNTYALREDETVWAAGRTSGLGGPQTVTDGNWQQVPGLRHILSVSAQSGASTESNHALAADSSGRVWYWDYTRRTPVAVPGISSAAAISAGVPCDMVLLRDGSAVFECYGPDGFIDPVPLSVGDLASVSAGMFDADHGPLGLRSAFAIGVDGSLYSFDSETGNYIVPFHTPDGTALRDPNGPSLAPGLTADTPYNWVGLGQRATFTEDAAWRGGIFSVRVEGVELAPEAYSANAGEFLIDGSVFNHAGSYDVEVWSENYLDARYTAEVVDSPGLPVTDVSGIPDGWATGPVTFTLTPSGDADPFSVRYALGDDEMSEYTAPVEVSAEGTTTLSFFTTDDAGQVEATKTATIKIDSGKPVTTIDGLPDNGISRTPVTFSLSSADDVSGVVPGAIRYVLDSVQPTATYTTPVQVTTGGQHTVTYWAKDVAGNKESAHTATFTISTEAARVSGADRYETASLVCASTFATGSCDAVVIATGADFPDALCAAGLAGAVEGPVLLTPKNAAPDMVVDEALRVTDGAAGPKAYIVGDTSVVSSALAARLMAAGFKVVRTSGSDRYSTSAAVAARIESIEGDDFSHQAFVVRGDTFPDALAVGPFAYSQAAPILLTRPDSLPSVTAATIAGLGVTDVVIAGSTSAVSATVATSIDLIPGVDTPVRAGGKNRYDTAVAVVEHGMSQGWGDVSYVGIATGTNFPDALAAAPVAGENGGVMLLTDPKVLSPQTAAFITAHKAEIGMCVVYGSDQAVSDGVRNAVTQLIK